MSAIALLLALLLAPRGSSASIAALAFHLVALLEDALGILPAVGCTSCMGLPADLAGHTLRRYVDVVTPFSTLAALRPKAIELFGGLLDLIDESLDMHVAVLVLLGQRIEVRKRRCSDGPGAGLLVSVIQHQTTAERLDGVAGLEARPETSPDLPELRHERQHPFRVVVNDPHLDQTRDIRGSSMIIDSVDNPMDIRQCRQPRPTDRVAVRLDAVEDRLSFMARIRIALHQGLRQGRAQLHVAALALSDRIRQD